MCLCVFVCDNAAASIAVLLLRVSRACRFLLSHRRMVGWWDGTHHTVFYSRFQSAQSGQSVSVYGSCVRHACITSLQLFWCLSCRRTSRLRIQTQSERPLPVALSKHENARDTERQRERGREGGRIHRRQCADCGRI